jgi:molybdopterin converting factor small subunit
MGSVRVKLPPSLRSAVPLGELECEADTVQEVIDQVVARVPAAAGCLLSERGRPLFLVLVNGRDARTLQNMSTPLAGGDSIALITPVGGG